MVVSQKDVDVQIRILVLVVFNTTANGVWNGVTSLFSLLRHNELEHLSESSRS